MWDVVGMILTFLSHRILILCSNTVIIIDALVSSTLSKHLYTVNIKMTWQLKCSYITHKVPSSPCRLNLMHSFIILSDVLLVTQIALTVSWTNYLIRAALLPAWTFCYGVKMTAGTPIYSKSIVFLLFFLFACWWNKTWNQRHAVLKHLFWRLLP